MSVQVFDQFRLPPSEPLVCPPEEGMTKQSFKEECDINVLLARYEKAGFLPPFDGMQFGDFSDVPTFQEAFEIVRVAEDQFAALPAQVRAECGHDPAQFLRKVQDPEFVKKHNLGVSPPSQPDSGLKAAADAMNAATAALKSQKAKAKKSDNSDDE